MWYVKLGKRILSQFLFSRCKNPGRNYVIVDSTVHIVCVDQRRVRESEVKREVEITGLTIRSEFPVTYHTSKRQKNVDPYWYIGSRPFTLQLTSSVQLQRPFREIFHYRNSPTKPFSRKQETGLREGKPDHTSTVRTSVSSVKGRYSYFFCTFPTVLSFYLPGVWGSPQYLEQYRRDLSTGDSNKTFF